MPEESPLVRQWILLRTLCSRHFGATVKEMSQEMGVSDKTIRRDLETFQKAGFPLEDFCAEVFDGSYHSVDSSDIAFKLAGSIAFRNVAVKAGPTLLEPIIEVSVTTPDEFMGDITGDLTSRRGKVMGMDADRGRTTIKARVPESELYKYASALRSMTQGRARHSRELVGYEPMPPDAAKLIVAAAKKAKEDD